MDIDSFQIDPFSEVWKMLWDSEHSGNGEAIGPESKLVDDLLMVGETLSSEGDCPGICDACLEVSCLVLPRSSRHATIAKLIAVEIAWALLSLL
jgi:hypothetical protein